jgi:hypothetical protein
MKLGVCFRPLSAVAAFSGLCVACCALAAASQPASQPTKSVTPQPQTVVQQLRASISFVPLASYQKVLLNASPAARSTAELEAFVQVLEGKHTEGITKMRAIEDRNPGENPGLPLRLSLAYEIAGDNRRALEWLSAHIRATPGIKDGTDWLRGAVLSAKIELDRQPDWLQRNHVLAINEKASNAGEFCKVGNRTLSRSDVQTALLHELKERMSYVKPKDPVVADLLYTFALVQNSARSYQSAADLLSLAEQYGYETSSQLRAELKLRGQR